MANNKKSSGNRNKTSSKGKTTTSKKTTSNKNINNKNKTNSKRKNIKQKKKDHYLNSEITIRLLLVAEIILMLSNFKLCGSIGDFLSFTIFGIFGIVGYVIPLILFGITFYLIVTEKENVFISKIISLIFLIFSICGLIQTIDAPVVKQSLSLYYLNSATEKTGGGIIGGFLYNNLSNLIGSPLTIALFVVSIIICVAIMMGKSIQDELEEKEYVRNNMIKINEQRIVNSQNRNAKRLPLSKLSIGNTENDKENKNVKKYNDETIKDNKVVLFEKNKIKEKNANKTLDDSDIS